MGEWDTERRLIINKQRLQHESSAMPAATWRAWFEETAEAYAVAEQEIERLRNDRIELAALLIYNVEGRPTAWGLLWPHERDEYRERAKDAGFAETVGFWKRDAILAARQQELENSGKL